MRKPAGADLFVRNAHRLRFNPHGACVHDSWTIRSDRCGAGAGGEGVNSEGNLFAAARAIAGGRTGIGVEPRKTLSGFFGVRCSFGRMPGHRAPTITIFLLLCWATCTSVEATNSNWAQKEFIITCWCAP